MSSFYHQINVAPEQIIDLYLRRLSTYFLREHYLELVQLFLMCLESESNINSIRKTGLDQKSKMNVQTFIFRKLFLLSTLLQSLKVVSDSLLH